jgi:hypothetical protein
VPSGESMVVWGAFLYFSLVLFLKKGPTPSKWLNPLKSSFS